MSLVDLTGGMFQALGGLFVLNSCRHVLKDKAVAGVSILSVAFFTTWGAWNLFFFWHLHQLWTFAGSVPIVSANVWYIFLLMKYRK